MNRPVTCLFPLVLALLTTASHAGEISGELKQWHTITLQFQGPDLNEERPTSNPFTDYELTALLIHPETTQRYVVPGFFAADGNAAETSATAGPIWQVRFSPSLVGQWTYQVQLKHKGQTIPIKGDSGEFTVAESDKQSPDLRHHGHLQYVGERYLRFAGSEQYFLKAGTDSPETLLGYHDFDGTWHDTQNHPIPAPHAPINLPSLDEGLHRYPDHVRDWRDSDPTWKTGKGKGLIGGLNYLADQGVNSIYFLTMNVNGDGRNVWPWTAPWKHNRFDVSKLDQWEIVFEHMQSRGIQMHVVLQETENDHLLDGGDLGPMRKLYLRELIARFAHHPAIVWNLGEENLQTPAQQQAMADYIRSIDPYNHPIVMHNDHYSPENIRETFDPHLGKSTLDGTAIQDFHWNDVHTHTKHYVAASRKTGKPWVVCADEMGGAQFGLPTDDQEPDHFNARSKGLWGNLMAGGAGVEWYFGWQNNSPQSDLSAETWRPRERMWKQSKIAIDFFQNHLPFERMQAADHLALAYADYCLAHPGEVYCIYLFNGGNTRLNLESHAGAFSVRWFDPRNGGELQSGSKQTVWGPGLVEIGEPPQAPGKDWVCLVRRTQPVFHAGWRKDKIVVEAEHFETQSKDDKRRWYLHKKSGELPKLTGADDPKTWVRGILSASKPASQSRFLRILPDTRKSHDDKLVRGENFSAEPGQMAIVNYRVHFDAPGRHYVWVRAFSTGTEDNGVHVGLNGQWPEHGKRMQWSDPKRQWVWGCAQRTEQVHSGVPMQIYLDIPSAGVHTVSFSMREDGFAMDQFLLTKDASYRPHGAEKGEAVHDLRIDQAPESRAAVHTQMVFPAENWMKGSPESQGIDSNRLQTALHYIAGHCKDEKLSELMIIRNGVCIYEGNRTDQVHNIWSCSKSFTSTVLGLLIAEGKCKLESKAASIDPALAQDYPDATLRHFTTMTSGYSAKGRSRWNDENSDWSWTPYQPETPLYEAGKGYAYWDENMMMLGRLLTIVGEREMNDYLHEKVFQPIGIGNVEWLHEGKVDQIPINNGCTNIKINARQMARFGHLFLNRGHWNGKQIVPAQWVDQATQTQVDTSIPVADTDRSHVRGSGAYGYNWWTNGGENRMPDAPPKTYYASGLNHNLLFVIPEWNMVVVRMGTDGNPAMGKPQAWNGFFRLLGESMLGDPQLKRDTGSRGSSKGESFRLDLGKRAQEWIEDGKIIGNGCDISVAEVAGETALRVETDQQFCNAFLDLKRLLGHSINMNNVNFISLRMLIPSGSQISAMKLNFKDQAGNLAGIPEIANNFYGTKDRWVDYSVDLRGRMDEAKIWHGNQSPVANVTELALNPYNSDQAKKSVFFVSRIAVRDHRSETGGVAPLLPQPKVSPNTKFHLDFDDPQQLHHLNAYRAFESSFQSFAKGIAGNPSMAVRVKGKPTNKHIAFLPMLDRITGAPVDFRKVNRIYFSYYVKEDSQTIDGSWLWLTSKDWNDILIDKQFHHEFIRGGWHQVSVKLKDLRLERAKGKAPVLPNVSELRIGFQYLGDQKDIEIWIDDFGWE